WRSPSAPGTIKAPPATPEPPMPRLLPLLAFCCLVPSLPAAAPPVPRAPREYSVEELARRARASVVVIRVRGRGAKTEGSGTGVALSPDGRIATNQHVIGEGRGITVELADGTTHDVTAVHAFDRKSDLAIIQVAATGLQPLPLGDPGKLVDGQSVVALG